MMMATNMKFKLQARLQAKCVSNYEYWRLSNLKQLAELTDGQQKKEDAPRLVET